LVLYEQINNSIAAVSNWDDGDLVWFGNILNQKTYSDFDTLIESYRVNSNWKGVAHIKRLTEYLKYKSATIDTAVKAFLDNMEMFTNYALPITDTDGNWFGIGAPCVLNGYRWARELDYQTSKWDPVTAYNGLHKVLASEENAFYRCNPDTGEGEQLFGGRIYEKDQLANCFWILWKSAGVSEAESDINTLWNYLQNHWSQCSEDCPTNYHYDYAPDVTGYGYVWDTPEILEVFGKYHVATGLSLSNFDRIATHMYGGYLQNNWNSCHFFHPHWGYYHFVVHYNSCLDAVLDNKERRMSGHFMAMCFLWQMWGQMTTEQKTIFRNMLMGNEGITQAWQVMLEDGHGMFDSSTNQFKDDSSDDNFSDIGTAKGATLLFLLGIAPTSVDSTAGRLAIPLRTLQLGSLHMVDPYCFKWDGDNKKIRIAVFAGSLTFMYGDSNVSYNFPRNGIYEVYFTSDYNNITKVTQIANLPFNYYLDKPIPATATDPTVHKNWQKIISKFKSAGITAEVTWRKLVLGVEPDSITGWFEKDYGEETITVLIVPKNRVWNALGPGTFTTLTYEMFTSSMVQDGDQIVYNNRYYEVKNVQPCYLGSNLLCRKCELVYLPFEGET